MPNAGHGRRRRPATYLNNLIINIYSCVRLVDLNGAASLLYTRAHISSHYCTLLCYGKIGKKKKNKYLPIIANGGYWRRLRGPGATDGFGDIWFRQRSIFPWDHNDYKVIRGGQRLDPRGPKLYNSRLYIFLITPETVIINRIVVMTYECDFRTLYIKRITIFFVNFSRKICLYTRHFQSVYLRIHGLNIGINPVSFLQ